MGTRRLIAACLSAALASILGVTHADAATRTWNNTVTHWSDPTGWVEHVVPVNGDDLVFPTIGFTPIINDIPNLHVHSITSSGQYAIAGEPLGIGEGGISLVPGTSAILQFNWIVTLDADQVWVPASGTIWIGYELRLNGFALNAGGTPGGLVRVDGLISGTGTLLVTGPFTDLRLVHANTYRGRTIVNAGRLIVMDPGALGVEDGTEANGTFVTSTSPTASGTLRLEAPGTLGNEALILSGPGTPFTNGGFPNAGAIENVAANVLTGPVTLVGDVLVHSIGTGTLTFQGPVGGTGRLVIGDGAIYVLANSANTFTGGVLMGPDGTPLTIGTLSFSADNALPGAPTLDLRNSSMCGIGVGRTQTLAGLTGNGAMNLGDASSTLVLTGNGETTFTGVLGALGTITHTGYGHQRFTSAFNGFAGSLHVQHGTVTIATGSMTATTDVSGDGRLSLMSNGRVGPLTLTGGHLLLSEGGAALGGSGALTMSAGSTLDLGAAVPASLGRLTVTGTVALNGSTLALSLPEGFAATVGAMFTILDNDGTDPIGGTFAGLPEGATLAIHGTTFRISYVGGTGNDVTLTVTDVARAYYLSEGATGGFFTTDLLLINPNDVAAPIAMTFLKDGGSTVLLSDTLPPMSHKTLRVNDVAGMEGTTFSTVVQSVNNLPLVVERTMSWDRTGYGAHTEHAVDGADLEWFFAEGSQGFFHTYLLLANPNSGTASHAAVQYLLESAPPVVRQYTIPPTSRLTVDVGNESALAGSSFGMRVTFDQPGMAERAMYFGDVPLWKGGHESAGVSAPSTDWFLAEGATGPFFETFVLLANPNPAEVTATLTYLPSTGVPVTVTRAVPANGRLTLNLEQEDPSLTNAAVATRVSAPLPIIVERSQYWPDPAPNWYEAHNSFGVTALGTKWGLAEGRVGGTENAQTYVLLANPGSVAANVSVTFLREAGKPPVTKTVVVQPTSRFSLPIGSGGLVPELTNEYFGALITSDSPIAVERALYWDANNQIWAAGTNATATRLP